MADIQKNHIHIINSEMFPIVEDLGINYIDSMNEALDELRSKLQFNGILRSAGVCFGNLGLAGLFYPRAR